MPNQKYISDIAEIEGTPCAEAIPCNGADAEDHSGCDGAATFFRGAILLQEKWVLIILYSLLAGPAGFSHLMRKGNINTTTLTQRLNLLEQAGLLVKTIHSTMPPRTGYELTEAGRALKPIMEAMTQWSATYLSVPEVAESCTGKESA